MPAEMSIALSRADLHARMHVASCWRRVHHRDRHQHTIPIALAALPGAILPRLRALALFGRRSPQRVDSLVMPASENLHTSGLMYRSNFAVEEPHLPALRAAHGPFSGNGRPAAWVAADIVRIED